MFCKEEEFGTGFKKKEGRFIKTLLPTTTSYFADHNCPILVLEKCIFSQSVNPLKAGTCTFPSYLTAGCDLICYMETWRNELLFEPQKLFSSHRKSLETS